MNTGRTISPSCTTPAARRPAIRSSAPIPATTGCGTTDAATAERKSITCTTSMSTTRGSICQRYTFPTCWAARRRTATAAPTSARRGSFRATAATTSMRRSPPGRAIRGRSSGTPATTPAPTSTQRSSSRALTKRRRNGKAPAQRPRRPTRAGAL